MPLIPDQANASPASRWSALGRVALFWLGYGAALFLGGWLSATFLPPSSLQQRTAYGAIASVGTLAVMWLLLRNERRRAADIGLALDRGSAPRLLLGCAIGFGLVAVYAAIIALTGNVHWERGSSIGPPAIAMNVAMFFALSSMEELGFRGYSLRRLEQPFGLWPALLIVAVMFGVYHFLMGWPLAKALIGAGTGSLLYGMAALASRGLALPIGLHAAWNIGDWMLGVKDSTGFWKPVVAEGSDARAQLAGSISYCTVTVAATLAFWLWYRRQQKLPISS
jgi:membrane protease YdiL (CAAX protease family)